jgi:hypothetical protein
MFDRITRNGRRAALAIGAALALAMAGCGGDGAGAGGSAGTSGGSASSSVTDITMFSDKATLPAADGATSAIVTAQVKDERNNVVANQVVSFSTTDTGVALTPQSTNGLTDSSGRATLRVDLAAGSVGRTNRSVVITAKTGTITRTTNIEITGTRMTLVGADTIAEGGGADYLITLLDGLNAAVAGVPVTVTFDQGTVSPAVATTGVNGQAAIRVTATKPGPAGKVTASALGLAPEKAVTILSLNAPFTFSAPTSGQSFDVNADQVVTVRYRQPGVAVSGKSVTMSTTRGTFVQSGTSIASVTTDANGDASATLRSAAAGQTTLSAVVSTGTGTLSTSTRVALVSRVPAKLSLSPSPTSISANAIGSSSSTSQLVATVRDANDNPVAGAQVAFSAIDPSSGRIEPGLATTDTDGQAVASFIAGANSTGQGAVQVRAAIVTAPAIFDVKAMTVSAAALFIELGTGNRISEIGSTAYSMPWDAIVTDANRNPVVGATVTASLEAIRYYKGVWVYQGSWSPQQFDDRANPPVACASEDVPQLGSSNPNNLLDAGEDRNGNAKLDPGSPAAVQITSTGGVTGANGLASLAIIYPKSFAQWVDVLLRVTISTSGTESSVSRPFLLPVLADDVKDAAIAPPNVGARLPVDLDPGPAGAPPRSLIGPYGYETARASAVNPVDGLSRTFCTSPN